MAFGGKLAKESEFEFDGMTFTVPRITNFVRRELQGIQRSDRSISDKLRDKYTVIAKHLIKDWSGVTLEKMQKYFVTNELYFGAKSFDANGDEVDVARANFEDMMVYIESLSESNYEKKAKVAIDDLLETKDAKIVYNGKERKMNATIREEIKASEEWEEVVDFVWDCAVLYNEFKKPLDDADKVIAFSDRAIEDYMTSGHWNLHEANLLDAIEKFAVDREQFRDKAISEDEEAAKN